MKSGAVALGGAILLAAPAAAWLLLLRGRTAAGRGCSAHSVVGLALGAAWLVVWYVNVYAGTGELSVGIAALCGHC